VAGAAAERKKIMVGSGTVSIDQLETNLNESKMKENESCMNGEEKK
jgi:hypothetical protein